MKNPIFAAVATAIVAAVATPAFAAVPASTGRLATEVADPVTAVSMKNDAMMMKHHKMRTRPAMHKHHKSHPMTHTKPMMKSM